MKLRLVGELDASYLVSFVSRDSWKTISLKSKL